MPTKRSPRKGSLQFWPRKRAAKFLPRVNWDSINSGKNLKGFICYKSGMMSAHVRDNTPNSMTKGKNIAIPITILECPPLKILSIRFYKDKRVVKEVLASEFLDKELKRKIKVPKSKKRIVDIKPEGYDDVRVIFYSQVKKTNIKKTPDLSEIGLVGSVEEKVNFIKENLGKEISVLDVFEKGQLVDLRGLTKGKGLSGPVKRLGIGLKDHKSEKGRRKPGSLGPWHPARVTFRAPMAGQLGMFTRVVYNNKIIDIGKSEDKLKNAQKSEISSATKAGAVPTHRHQKALEGIKNYGDIKTDYLLVSGSIQGPAKRQLIITHPLRETKKQLKKDFELLEIR